MCVSPGRCRRPHQPPIRQTLSGSLSLLSGLYFLILERQPEAQSELPFVVLPAQTVGASNDTETIEIADGSVRIQLKIRDIRCRVREVRSICGVERLETELQGSRATQRECPEHAEIEIRHAGPAKGVKPGRPETDLRYRPERRDVEIGSETTEDLDILYLIGCLVRAVTRVQRPVCRRHGERGPGSGGEKRIHLPPTQ